MTPGSIPPLPPRGYRRIEPSGEPKKTQVKAVLKYVLILAIIIGLAGSIFLVYTYMNVEDTLDQIDSGTDIEVADKDLAKEKPLTILLLGLDSRPETGTLNTDVIMIASFNPENKSVTLVSLPRDTYVKVEDWKARKANAFYSILYNDNKETLYSEIKPIYSEFMGIPIDYVTVIDFKTFEGIVNELGGVTIDVDQDMHYEDPTDGTHIDLKQGVQELDGDQALDFVRYRHSNHGETPESSDVDRNRRQQAVIAAMVGKLKSFNALLKVNGILNVMGKNIRTDIPNQQLKSLIKTYATVSNDKIEYVPIEGVWKSPYIYLDEAQFEAAKAALQKQLSSDPVSSN
jgi:LCP family protein required for cell wall assembly